MERRNLTKLVQILSTVGGLDKAFKIIVYALRIVAFRTKTSNPQLASKLVAFTSPISDTRMVMRMFGLLGILDGIQTSKPSSDIEATLIEIVQTLSMMIYYPTEHIYWLAVHKVVQLEDPDKYSRFSCRAWAVYIALDLYQCLKKLSQNSRALVDFERSVKASLYSGYLGGASGTSSSVSASTTTSTTHQQSSTAYSTSQTTKKKQSIQVLNSPESEFVSMTKRKELYALRREKQRLQLRLIVSLCDLPMALHWSTTSYPLNDFSVGVLGLISGAVSWYLTWTANAD